MDISEAYHHEEKQDLPFLVIVGKRGKMQRKEQLLAHHPGRRHAPCYLGKVRHSLANGTMEKGASASALSSTSGDEIVGICYAPPSRIVAYFFISYLLLPFLWDRVNPGITLMPGKQAKSFGMELMENNFVSKWDTRMVVDPRPYDRTPELQQNGEKNQ